MGLFDEFQTLNNKVGVNPGNYQSKVIPGSYNIYHIDPEGVLKSGPIDGSKYTPWVTPITKSDSKPDGFTGMLNFYDDNLIDYWVIVIKDEIVFTVHDRTFKYLKSGLTALDLLNACHHDEYAKRFISEHFPK